MKTLSFIIILCVMNLPMAYSKGNQYMSTICSDKLQNLSEERSEQINSLIVDIINNSPGDDFERKTKYAVEHTLPECASMYYFVFNTLGMWSNGGMQQVLLCETDDIFLNRWELEQAVKAFKYYDYKETADLIKKLIPKSEKWSRAIGELNDRESKGEKVSEAEFDKIWNEVDRLDDLFEQTYFKDLNTQEK